MYVIVIAMFGAFVAVIMSENMNFIYFQDSIVSAISFSDLLPALGKTFVFGYITGIVGAYKGYTATGGTVGVGRASTTAVVMSSLLILLFDMVMVKITVWLWP